MKRYKCFAALVRFVAGVPFFWFSLNSLVDWQKLQGHDTPPGVPWANPLYIGLALAGAGGLPYSFYNYFLLLATLYVKNGAGFACLAVADIIPTAILVASAVLEFTYLPGTQAACSAVGDLPTINGQPSVFNFTGEIYGQTAESVCERFMVEWTLVAFVAVLYVILTIFEAITAFALDWDARTSPGSADPGQSPFGSMWNLLTWVPRNTSTLVRLAAGYQRKRRQRRTEAAFAASPAESLQAPLPTTHEKHLCPPSDASVPSPMSECWACTRPICPRCTHTRALAPPRTTTHLEHCAPRCTRCHISALRRPPASAHAPAARARLRCAHESDRGGAAAGGAVARPVCAACNDLADAQVTEAREWRERGEIRHLAESRMLSCCGCGRRIGELESVRWWWCGGGGGGAGDPEADGGEGGCGKECKSAVHPAWGER